MSINRIREIAIIGTGLIGTSLSVLTTTHGIKTKLFAVDDQQKEMSEKKYDDFISELVNNQLMNKKQAEKAKSLLTYTCEYKDLKDCDLAFEAVVEILDIKHRVYNNLEENCPNIKAICSVSSAIEVDDLASNSDKYKDRIIVTHPFYPPHMVPYFEISTGSKTDENVITTVVELLEYLDRKPVILKKSAPGFIGNRLQFALWREALNIVNEGIANPEDIDTCLRYSFCPRYTSIGMFEHFDNGGLDLNIRVSESIFKDLSNMTNPPDLLKEKVENNKLGVKTKEGFYKWDDESIEDLQKRVSEPFFGFFKTNLGK